MTTTMNKETKVPINSDADIVVARQKGRELSVHLGFSPTDATLIATAISELARNIVLYANRGEIVVATNGDGRKPRIVVVARDEGPGIADVPLAIAGGHSASGGLGLGLAGERRVMDEFEIISEPRKGTTVTIKRWKR